MAIKAGRVGVAPDQVDEFGNINSEATSGYTKQEADSKFETQTHAASTYETKTDAAVLQPKTLAVPIELLSGSALTVESALQGLTGEINTNYGVKTSVGSSINQGIDQSVGNTAFKTNYNGYCLEVVLDFTVGADAIPAWETICAFPEAPVRISSDNVLCLIQDRSDNEIYGARYSFGNNNILSFSYIFKANTRYNVYFVQAI